MPNSDDSELNADTAPLESAAVEDALLDRTQVFADDSSPTGSGSKSATGGGSPSSATTKNQKSVGGYRLIKLLGEGGMGRVFQAADESGRMVAIKLLSPELSRSPEALDRFKQEGVIASAISHPHCVFVHRADEDCGTPFIAMELMTGQTLKDVVAKRGPLPHTDAIPLALHCIDGLIEAHSRGMIHRDVKPANCYLDDQGNVKIGDFGLARSLVSDSELTRTGSFLGTPLYASPEQILGEKVDEQSDIYSLAATIYFLLAGKAPFESPHATQVIAKIVSADPPGFSEVGIKVPKKLEQVVMRGLARDRAKRYSTLQEFRDELVQTLALRDRVSPLTRRILAFMVDNFLLTVLFGLPVVLGLLFGERFLESQTFINLAGIFWQGTYLLISESIFGATVGKRLLSLRVVDAELNARPKFWKCFLRTLIFILVFNGVELATVVVFAMFGKSMLDAPIVFAAASWTGMLIGYAATLSMWFYGGKQQLLHEWVSGTQTLVASPKSASNTIDLPDLNWTAQLLPIESNSGLPSHFGRFEILGRIATTDGSGWLSAHDQTIERSVWIQFSSAAAPPPSEARQKCVRRTRMRFLESGIDGTWRWDAYVAPDGAPLALWFDSRNPMPWPVTQQVLAEAIEEINLSGSTQLAEEGIGRWWLTSAGKVTLSEAQMSIGRETTGTKSKKNCLFSEIASLALPDRGSSPSGPYRPKTVLNKTSRCVPTWRATKFLQRLKVGHSVDPRQVQAELIKVKQGPQIVTAATRGIQAIVLSLAMFFPWLVVAIALLFPTVSKLIDLQKDARLMTTLAAVLRDPVNQSKLIDGLEASNRDSYQQLEKIESIEQMGLEKHSLFNKAYNQVGFLERGLMDLMNQFRGRENFAAPPKPNFDQLVASDEEKATVERDQKASRDDRIKSPKIAIKSGAIFDVVRVPESPQTMKAAIERFDKLVRERESPEGENWYPRVRDLVFIPSAVLVVWGGLLRGGLTHAVSGIAVVRRDGRRGWILQCMWRSLLFWTPLFLTAGFCLALETKGIDWMWWTQQLRRCFFVLPFLYLIAVLRWPSRGPQDVLSGTYVVPR